MNIIIFLPHSERPFSSIHCFFWKIISPPPLRECMLTHSGLPWEHWRVFVQKVMTPLVWFLTEPVSGLHRYEVGLSCVSIGNHQATSFHLSPSVALTPTLLETVPDQGQTYLANSLRKYYSLCNAMPFMKNIVTNSRPPGCDRPRFSNRNRIAHRMDNSVVTFRS